MKNLKKN